MTTFLWAMIVLCGLGVVGKLLWLATGRLPPRTPFQEAADVAFNAAVVVWAAVLLARL